MSRKGSPKNQTGKFLVILPTDIMLDLDALCAACYRAGRSAVIEKALQEHIQNRLSNEPILRQMFNDERARLGKPASEVLKLVDIPKKI